VLNKNTYLWLALLWTCIITVLSLVTIGNVGTSIPIPNKDKYVHFTFYFVFVVVWSLFAKQTKITKKIQWIVLSSAIGYGVLMEVCQGVFTTTRTPDIMDVLANIIGALSGLLFITMIFKKYKTTP
jgi:VanZ family protein